jgi:hypothetical protein
LVAEVCLSNLQQIQCTSKLFDIITRIGAWAISWSLALQSFMIKSLLEIPCVLKIGKNPRIFKEHSLNPTIDPSLILKWCNQRIWIHPKFLTCSSKSFKIAPHFSPICFGKCCSPFTKVIMPINLNRTFRFQGVYVVSLYLSDRPIKLAHSKKIFELWRHLM